MPAHKISVQIPKGEDGDDLHLSRKRMHGDKNQDKKVILFPPRRYREKVETHSVISVNKLLYAFHHNCD